MVEHPLDGVIYGNRSVWEADSLIETLTRILFLFNYSLSGKEYLVYFFDILSNVLTRMLQSTSFTVC